MNAHSVLIIIAIICEVIAALGVPVGDRINAMALGFVFFFISMLVPA